MQVPAADDRYILRNTQPSFQDRIHCANCQWIVICKNPVWERLVSQQETHGFGAEPNTFDIYTGTSDDQGFGILEPSALKRILVSVKSSNSRAVISSSNMSDHTAPLINEVFCRHPSSSFIVCAHEVGCEALNFSVDQYIRKSLAINSIKQIRNRCC